MYKTSDLRVDFLGIVPEFELDGRKFDAQSIAALSALLTFKGKSIQELYQEAVDKEQDLDQKVLKILQKSSLRGHASVATTPVISVSFQGSKFLDALLTPLVFASGLMASGRRTSTSEEDIVFPSSIAQNSEARELYAQASKANIDLFNSLLEQDLRKDEVSKILQYGIIGTGIVSLSVESVVALWREYQREKEWMPEDMGLFLDAVQGELENLGIDILYPTRCVAPKDVYPFPNIFKDPRQGNIVRELVQAHLASDFTQIIESSAVWTAGLARELADLAKMRDELTAGENTIKAGWWDFLAKREQICRDYATSANIKILSSVSWRVWGEKKRHRTVPMVSESLYYKIRQTSDYFASIEAQLEQDNWDDELVRRIDHYFSIPAGVRKDAANQRAWVLQARDAFVAYGRLVDLGIAERDAVYVIPRGIRVDVLQDYNLYNLISGYFPLRLCSTAEEQMRAITQIEVQKMQELFAGKGYDALAQHIVPKCHVVGFCPEEKNCAQILDMVDGYTSEFHKQMKLELDRMWQEV